MCQIAYDRDANHKVIYLKRENEIKKAADIIFNPGQEYSEDDGKTWSHHLRLDNRRSTTYPDAKD